MTSPTRRRNTGGIDLSKGSIQVEKDAGGALSPAILELDTINKSWLKEPHADSNVSSQPVSRSRDSYQLSKLPRTFIKFLTLYFLTTLD